TSRDRSIASASGKCSPGEQPICRWGGARAGAAFCAVAGASWPHALGEREATGLQGASRFVSASTGPCDGDRRSGARTYRFGFGRPTCGARTYRSGFGRLTIGARTYKIAYDLQATDVREQRGAVAALSRSRPSGFRATVPVEEAADEPAAVRP